MLAANVSRSPNSVRTFVDGGTTRSSGTRSRTRSRLLADMAETSVSEADATPLSWRRRRAPQGSPEATVRLGLAAESGGGATRHASHPPQLAGRPARYLASGVTVA